MTGKGVDVRKIAAAIAAEVSGLKQRGRLLAVVPRGRILRGLYLDRSIDKERFYVSAFVQPLYVPSVHLVFNLGIRLGGPSKAWLITEANELIAAVRREGMPFIADIVSPEDFVQWPVACGQADEYSREAMAYSLIAAGQYGEALDGLARLASGQPDATDWQRELAERAERMAGLCRTNPGAAQSLLREWESNTAAALGLEQLD